MVVVLYIYVNKIMINICFQGIFFVVLILLKFLNIIRFIIVKLVMEVIFIELLINFDYI